MTGRARPVQMEDVRKTYPNGVEALKGVSLTVPRARSSACSARTARGRRRPWGS
jgi:hypothetical protein